MHDSEVGLVGELAAVIVDGGSVRDADAHRLLMGYAGPRRTGWSSDRVAVSCGGAAELSVFADLVVAVDGRLDNRREIAALTGRAPTDPLPELVAELWRRRGIAAVDLLVGDLAGLVVDRVTEDVTGWRDLCAGRPLHAGRLQGGWGFASEWQPIISALGRRDPDPEWFASAMVGHSINPRCTPYRGVEVVLPGHVATPAGTRLRQTQVAQWRIPLLRDTREGAYAEAFRALFDEAVRCRTDGRSVGVGVSLSGGLDSTSVLATLHAVAPGLHRTALCLPITDPEGDERSIQTLMAQRTESDLRWVPIDGLGPFGRSGTEALFEHEGAPPQVVNWFYGDALADAAQGLGLKIVLDGEDGDGAVGGSYTYLADLLATGRWRRWLSEVNAMRAIGARSGRESFQESLQLSVPPLVRRLTMRRRGEAYTPEAVSAGLAQTLELERRLQRGFLNQSWEPGRMFATAQREVGTAERMTGTFTTISAPWRRRGIELTHPWTDRRLMSFCMGLPFAHVRARAFPKIVLRQAMSERLPRVLLEHNGKADLSQVIRRTVGGRDARTVADGLALARTQPEWFAPTGVEALESDFRDGTEFPMASRVAMFARWLRWCDAA